MGRPTNDPKTHTLKIRLSEIDIDKLNNCQKITGKTKSDIIRTGINLFYNELNN